MKYLGFLLLASLSLWRFEGQRKERDLALNWCAKQADPLRPRAEILGTPQPLPFGRQGLAQPRIRRGEGKWALFAGEVLIRPELAVPNLGRQVLISGPMHCSTPLRNPGRQEDQLFWFTQSRVNLMGSRYAVKLSDEKEPIGVKWRRAIQNKMKDLCGGHSQLHALERAVWFGDLEGMPTRIKEFYYEGGMAAILALSGQHVTSLLLGISFIQLLVLRWLWPLLGKNFRRGYAVWCEVLPLLCAGLLYFVSGGAPPIARTLAMAVSITVLRWRGFHCSTWQLTASSVALLILWDASLMDSTSFFLSAFATALTAGVLNEARPARRLGAYFLGSMVMPILAWPLSAFAFAKISLTAPIHNLLLAWLWEFFLIPVCFFLPLFLWGLPRAWREGVAGWLEQKWIWLLEIQEKLAEVLPPIYRACLRPTWWEFALVELLLILLFFAALNSWRSATKHDALR